MVQSLGTGARVAEGCGKHDRVKLVAAQAMVVECD